MYLRSFSVLWLLSSLQKHQVESVFLNKEDCNDSDYGSNVPPCSPNQPLVLTNASDIIISPGRCSFKYPKEQQCSWKIVAPAGHLVKLKVNDFDIKGSDGCREDSVQVWDVRDGALFRLGTFCGPHEPVELLQSTGQQLLVTFKSGASEGKKGFAFKWEFFDPMFSQPSDSCCGKPNVGPKVEQRIVNGDEAVPHSWPWQVSLRNKNETGHFEHNCGGSIISSTAVLTAAHCVFGEEGKIKIEDIQVVAGEHNETNQADGPIQIPPIKDIIVHDYYDPSSEILLNDIAVILFSSPLIFDENVGSVCLPVDNPSIDDLCYVTGWGVTQDTGSNKVLRQVKLPIVSHTICRQCDKYGSMITQNVLCAGFEEGGKDSCQGDSGGPFVCKNRLNGRWYLQGIVSWGEGCAEPLMPGIYTRVTSFLLWIFDHAKVKP